MSDFKENYRLFQSNDVQISPNVVNAVWVDCEYHVGLTVQISIDVTVPMFVLTRLAAFIANEDENNFISQIPIHPRRFLRIKLAINIIPAFSR